MHTHEVFALASREGVSVTFPELQCDIDAQISALLDTDHPKNCVFLCRDQPAPNWTLPDWIFVERRPEGTLLTDSAHIAAMYRTADWVTDELIAAILGYPEPKSLLIGRNDVLVAQALDKNGCVVFEALCSKAGLDAALAAAAQQVPLNGCVHMTTPQDALARRIRGKTN